VPSHGQSLDSITGRLNEGEARPLPGQDWLRQPVPRAYDDPDDAAFSEPRCSAQSSGTFSEAVRLTRALQDWPFSLTYIKATGEPRGTAVALSGSQATMRKTAPGGAITR